MLQLLRQPEALLAALFLIIAGTRLWVDLNWIHALSQGRKRHWMQAVATAWVAMGVIMVLAFWALN